MTHVKGIESNKNIADDPYVAQSFGLGAFLSDEKRSIE
jgi:hypothetical protein